MTYLLRTSRGCTICAHDSLERARQDRDKRQAAYPHPLVIVEQQVSERAVA